MTHEQRNAAISKKIAAYTIKFTGTKKAAKDALKREKLSSATSRKESKKTIAA